MVSEAPGDLYWGLNGGTSASRTDEKDGERGDDKGRAEKEVKLRRQPAAIQQRAARERRKDCSEAADADRPPHAGGTHCSRIEWWSDGIEPRHRRVRDDAEQQRRPERDVQPAQDKSERNDQQSTADECTEQQAVRVGAAPAAKAKRPQPAIPPKFNRTPPVSPAPALNPAAFRSRGVQLKME